ncbi:Hypothetical predicted protein [Octopus vulgaris]|uniref:Uncharacterized protein n=1 Tax=Octopus vulgaris TaxID=6645 RepID=A0AA36FDU1_OCTVU|nr:Hypothetical predicted protein [Octopus vulgaris]
MKVHQGIQRTPFLCAASSKPRCPHPAIMSRCVYKMPEDCFNAIIQMLSFPFSSETFKRHIHIKISAASVNTLASNNVLECLLTIQRAKEQQLSPPWPPPESNGVNATLPKLSHCTSC